MASKIRTLSVKVDADFSAIKKNTEIAAKAMKDGFGNFNLTQTTSALSGLNESIRLTRSEFKASVAGMDDWSESAEGLQARIKYLNDVTDDQRVILEGLKHQHQLVAKETGEDSKKATDLQVKINNQTADSDRMKRSLRRSQSSLITTVKRLTMPRVRLLIWAIHLSLSLPGQLSQPAREKQLKP